jgi:hypothetical protein
MAHARTGSFADVYVEVDDWPIVCDPKLNFVTPQLREVLDLWQARREGRTMPSRQEFTLHDLKNVAPNMALIDFVQGDVPRFRFRLVGSYIERFMAPAQGKFLDEAFPAKFVRKWGTLWQTAINDRKPLRLFCRVEFNNQQFKIAETLLLPLASDGETPDMVMNVIFDHTTADAIQPATPLGLILARELDETLENPNVVRIGSQPPAPSMIAAK